MFNCANPLKFFFSFLVCMYVNKVPEFTYFSVGIKLFVEYFSIAFLAFYLLFSFSLREKYSKNCNLVQCKVFTLNFSEKIFVHESNVLFSGIPYLSEVCLECCLVYLDLNLDRYLVVLSQATTLYTLLVLAFSPAPLI